MFYVTVCQGERKVPSDQCYIQFLATNPYLTIGTALAAFYLPVLTMCWLYGRIYFETRRRHADLVGLQAHRSRASSVLKDDDSSDADVSCTAHSRPVGV